MEKKRKQGRPTKYDKKYDEMIIEHMAQGFSNQSFAGKIGIKTTTNFFRVNEDRRSKTSAISRRNCTKTC